MEITTYLSNIEASIHGKTEEFIKLKAEIGVLDDLIKTTKAECDNLAAHYKILEHSSDQSDIEQGHEVFEKLIQKWTKFKFYGDKKKEAEANLFDVTKDLSGLLLEKAHVEVVHLGMND